MSEILENEVCTVVEKLAGSLFSVSETNVTDKAANLKLTYDMPMAAEKTVVIEDDFVDIWDFGETVMIIVNGPNKREIQEILGIEVSDAQQEDDCQEEKDAEEPKSFVLSTGEYMTRLAHTRLAVVRYLEKSGKSIEVWSAHCELLETIVALRELGILEEELAEDVDRMDAKVFDSIGKL